VTVPPGGSRSRRAGYFTSALRLLAIPFQTELPEDRHEIHTFRPLHSDDHRRSFRSMVVASAGFTLSGYLARVARLPPALHLRTSLQLRFRIRVSPRPDDARANRARLKGQ
jgi:hypothetical protein